MDKISLTGSYAELSAQMRRSSKQVSVGVSRLSSGNRIAHASDDVAGMSVSTKMLSRVTTIRSSLTNLAQASSMMQVMDGALKEVDDILHRMNTLTVMASSGATSKADKSFLQIEMEQLRDEIDRMLANTTFNGVQLFGQTFVPQDADPPSSTITSLHEIADLSAGAYTLRVEDEEITTRVDEYENEKTGETEKWLLIGRGREGWEFDADGQGLATDLVKGLGTPDAFDPVALNSTSITTLMRESGVDLENMEIRFKRALNPEGTDYQEARFRPDQESDDWLWTFSGHGLYSGDFETFDSSRGSGTTQFGVSLRNANGTGNNQNRIFTFPWAGHGREKGFSYGFGINNGSNSPGSFLWERTNENHAIPYTEVYIRIKDDQKLSEEPIAETFVDPRSIKGLTAWYDAADIDGDGRQEGAAEIGRDGTSINQWVDKAGIQQNLTPQNGTPQVTGQINGIDVVNFNNTTRMQALSALPDITSEMQAFIVARENVRANGRLASFNGFNTNYSGTTAPNNRFILYGPFGSGDYFFDAGGGNNNRVRITDVDTGYRVTEIGSTSLNTAFKSVSEGRNGLSVNGGQYYGQDRDIGVGVTPSYTTSGLLLGQNTVDQDIAEIVIFDRKLSADETARVEQYLGNKWDVDAFVNQGFDNNDPNKALTFDVVESAAKGTVIGKAAPSFFGDDVTYRLAYGNGELFDIDERTGEIRVAGVEAFDYERTQDYRLTVEASGPSIGSASYFQDIVINVQDEIERVTFVVGERSDNILSISTDHLNSDILFGVAPLEIVTQESATESQERIQRAIDVITARRANVGAEQSSTAILTAAQQSNLVNQRYAHAVIADTNIVQESTDIAQSRVQHQMTATVLAQQHEIQRSTINGIMDHAIQVNTII